MWLEINGFFFSIEALALAKDGSDRLQINRRANVKQIYAEKTMAPHQPETIWMGLDADVVGQT